MIRKPTLCRRRYIDQTGRIIVAPEDNAPAHAQRLVQIALPDNVETLIAIGPNEERLEGDLPQDWTTPTLEALGEGQSFMWTPVIGGTNMRIPLLAGQWIAACVKRGDAVLGVVIEYGGGSRE